MLVSSIARFNAFKAVAPAQVLQSISSFNGLSANNNSKQANHAISLKNIKSMAQKLNIFA